MAPQVPLMLPVHLILELDRMALTLVEAFMNRVKIEWDATRYAEKLPKKFPRPGTAAADAGEAIMRRQYPPRNDSAADIPISRPCIIVDMQGVILAWHLPGILNDSRQSEMMAATAKLHPLLEKRRTGTSWRLDPGYFPSGLDGHQGLIDLSPAWFQQGHEVSVSLKNPAALDWLDRATETNSIMGAILAVIHPELYDAGRDTFKVLRSCSEIKPQEILHKWTSVYSGISVICNRLTPPHRDTYQREYARRKRAPGYRKVSKAERALLEERCAQRCMLMAVEDLPKCSKAALSWGYECSLILQSKSADSRRTPDMIEEEERARNCFDELKFILQTFCLFPWIEPFQKHVEDFIQERLSEAASIIAVPGIEEEDSIRLHGLRRLVAGAIQEVELVQQPGYAATCAREDGAIIWDGRGVNSRKFRQRYGW
ncbi:hypothetical protein H4582DRAFT_2082573 [Lactarius indigo]|nr:hypothetical protein H4582DRAFT_2085077 [Lactarius indigo]KAI9433117.1 hypothetical protein H4582DRAFT_2082573 [Lactarius indigo]